MLRMLVDNCSWRFTKDHFDYLVGNATTVQELYQQLDDLATSLSPCGESMVRVNKVLFSLNKLALTSNKNDTYMQHYAYMWDCFVACKNRLSTYLPMCQLGVRIEVLAELYVKCTQLCCNTDEWENFCNRANDIIGLSDKELRLMDCALMLVKCKYYCAVSQQICQDITKEHLLLAFVSNNQDVIAHSYTSNQYYSNMSYSGKISSVVDCFGGSKVALQGKAVDVALLCNLTSNGRNIIDTFVNHKYGKRTSNYYSLHKTCKLSMQYFIKDHCEIRRYRVDNISSRATRYSLNTRTDISCKQGGCECFEIEGVDCVAIGEDRYVATCAVVDNKIISIAKCTSSNNNNVKSKFDIAFVLKSQHSYNVDIVTIYASTIEQLRHQIALVNTIGYCKCRVYQDQYDNGQLYSIKTNVSYGNNMFVSQHDQIMSNNINFTYQLEGNNVATLLDNSGNSATLVNGFCFGINGEQAYDISNNKVTNINSGRCSIVENGYVYNNNDNQYCATHTAEGKTVSVSSSGTKLLIFPLEEQSQVTYCNNEFVIKSKSRSFVMSVSNNLSCYTTNSMECNNNRIRKKLSNNLNAGTTLALVFNIGQACVNIANLNSIGNNDSVIRESLLSTYLNYHNEKNIFAVFNQLKPINALMLASMVYTNSSFVKKILLLCSNSGRDIVSSYYTQQGKKISVSDPLAYSLALVYYLSITSDKSLLTEYSLQQLRDSMATTYKGKNICIKALILLKMSQLGIDKVKTLLQYNNVRSTILSNKDLYGYAQAIGAVPMVNASKQRLRDLCNINKIDKCWYYVSQLENLYGINVVGTRLTIKPTVTTSQGLEQLMLNFHHKRINATFCKDVVYSLVLNGKKCFQGVDLSTIDRDNKLTVSF